MAKGMPCSSIFSSMFRNSGLAFFSGSGLGFGFSTGAGAGAGAGAGSCFFSGTV
ncbi:MAG: hypothetical protein ACRET7_01330 [Burkholderiales bacterium]